MPQTPLGCLTFFETSPTPETGIPRHKLVFQNESVPRLATLKRVPRFPTRFCNVVALSSPFSQPSPQACHVIHSNAELLSL